MNCRKARSYLSASYDGSLNSNLAKEMEAHIRSCKSCEREKLYIEEIVAAARAMPQKHVPEDFNLQLMNRIFAEQHRPTESYLPLREPSLWRRPLAWASSLAAVGVCALLAITFTRNNQLPTPGEPLLTNQPASNAAVVQQVNYVTSEPYAQRRQEPPAFYENILGVSGERSNYRATSIQNARSLRLADATIESLYVAHLKRMRQASAQFNYASQAGARFYQKPFSGRSTPVFRQVNTDSPLLRNAAVVR